MFGIATKRFVAQQIANIYDLVDSDIKAAIADLLEQQEREVVMKIDWDAFLANNLNYFTTNTTNTLTPDK